jgi:ParB-like chromosome segregation protein Spo0J
MTIEHLKTSDLIPYARNAKKHDASQVAKLAGSIREFGFNNPVLIDKDNGIIAGHGRILAAQSLALETVPCIRLGHLTDTQRRAYILADNRLAEIGGGWDEEMLKLELADLAALDVDVAEIGFTDSDAGVFDISETEMPALADGDKQPFQQKTFTLHDEQAEEVEAAISKAKEMGHAQSAVNENSNGNALAFICQSFNRANA